VTMRDYTRFIPGEEIGVSAPWDFDAVDTASLLLNKQAKAREDASEQARSEVSRQEGYAEGFAQGRAQATLEAQRQINEFTQHQGEDAARRFATLIDAAQTQLAQAQQVIARGVLELACELARQVLRHELSVNPNALQPVIREALSVLMGDGKSAVIRLNPIDMEVLQDVLRTEFATLSLILLSDSAVNPGGCLIESSGTVVDGSLQRRWMRAVANLGLDQPWEVLGDES